MKSKSLNPVILIADDAPLNLLLMRSIINKIRPDAVVIEAANGREAINQINENNIDLIFMDIQMPGLDGIGATKEIRESEKYSEDHIPIIALTAMNLPEEKELCLKAGMDKFLSKPVDRAKLSELLGYYLDK